MEIGSELLSGRRKAITPADHGFVATGSQVGEVLAARGAVNLHAAKYALDDFQKAIDDLDAGRVRGRAILVP